MEELVYKPMFIIVTGVSFSLTPLPLASSNPHLTIVLTRRHNFVRTAALDRSLYRTILRSFPDLETPQHLFPSTRFEDGRTPSLVPDDVVLGGVERSRRSCVGSGNERGSCSCPTNDSTRRGRVDGRRLWRYDRKDD